MTRLAVISSGKYTCFSRAIAKLPKTIQDQLLISIFAPDENELLSSGDFNHMHISYYQISQKPSSETYIEILEQLNPLTDAILVYSKFLIPKQIYSNFLCINFHPSVLPSFPGLNGFQDAINSQQLGFSAHVIDQTIDLGKPIISVSIDPFPSCSINSLQQLSYQLCQLISLFIINKICSNDIHNEPYRHFKSNTIQSLQESLL